MPNLSRWFLLAVAGAFVAAVSWLGASFTGSAEAGGQAPSAWLLWLPLAMLLASPLWLPAVFAARPGKVAGVVRLASAATILIPMRYVGSIALHQARMYPGPWFSAGTFAVAVTLGAAGVAAIVVLVLPSLRRATGEAG
jgi:hypothetical protein